MESALLHPFDALAWFRSYNNIRLELTALLEHDPDLPGSPAQRINDVYIGKINFADAYILKRLLQRYRPKEILEVGSYVGFSTRLLVEISAEWDGHVTAVDPNIRHKSFDLPAEVLKKFNARFIPGRLEVVEAFFGEPGSCYQDYETYQPIRSREYVDKLVAQRRKITADWDRKFDFIFIDGDHSYEAAKDNFDLALKFLKEGGCITFHDPLTWPGVQRALDVIAAEYKGAADVRVFGRLDRRVFQGIFGKASSGIGLFKPHPKMWTLKGQI